MKRGLVYFLAGLSAFLFFLLLKFPASLLVEQLAQRSGTQQIVAAGVNGSVWNGSARSLSANGLTLGKTEWQIRWTDLLRGRLSYSLESQIENLPLTGIASLGLGGMVHLQSLRGKVPLQALARIMPSGFFNGAIDVQLDEVQLENGWPVSADGMLMIDGLMLLTMQPALALGSFSIAFNDQDGDPLLGILEDVSGSLDLQGTLILSNDRSYSLDATVSAKAGSPPEITQILNFLGPADASGKRALKHTGRL